LKKLRICVFAITALAFCLILIPQKPAISHANNNASYARIVNSTTHLYRTPTLNSGVENRWCILQRTFFVRVLNTFNEHFYKVEYMGVIGYVRINEVQLVNETPINPFPSNITFNIRNNTSVNLRHTPRVRPATSNILGVIPMGTTNLEFIGRIIGEEAVDFQGTIWYLTRFNGTLGFVYSYFSDTFIPEPINNEITTSRLITGNGSLTPLTNTQNLIYIVAMLIPVGVVLFLLYKPRKTRSKIKVNLNQQHNILPSTREFYDHENH